MNISLLEENWEWAQNFWINKCRELSIPTTRISKRKRRILSSSGWILKLNYHFKGAGICKYRQKEVHITVFRLCQDRHYIKNTILHEIAHILTPSCGHNVKWKQVAVSIGAKPYSYGPYEPFRYYRICPNGCSKKGYYNRVKCNKICTYCNLSLQSIPNY